MTAAPEAPAHRMVQGQGNQIGARSVTLRRVIVSEWIKFASLRSTWAVLGAAVLGMIVLALVVAYNTRHLGPTLQPDDTVASSTMQGYYLGQLLIGALGVLFVTGEFSTGMIRSTLAAVPQRFLVVWAKLVVFVSVTATSMVVVCLLSFLAAQALISHYRTGFSLADPGVARVVIGTAIYLTLIGMLGGAVAWIVRSTPGSLVAYVAIVLVLPVLFGSVLGNWGKDVAEYLPSTAGGSFVMSLREPYTLAPWAGFGVLVLWVAGALVVAAVTLRRRDA